ncbi:MAG: TIGR04283 family arsenosugar biosynthesis glycosyltransferase [Methylococcales bacterium]
MERDSTQTLALSIIIPALNEAAVIAATLSELQVFKNDEVEIIVVDGGSSDRTAEIAGRYAGRVLIEPGGRAIQMNHGAKQARGSYLLFLHADTRMPPNTLEILNPCFHQECVWGRFDIRLSGANPLFRLVEFCMNLRSRLTGIATGDQSIFVKRSIFGDLGGYPEIPIMEDIALSKALKKIAAPVCLKQPVTTSSRRWEQRGMVRSILLMWILRLLYFLDADPHLLERWYR